MYCCLTPPVGQAELVVSPPVSTQPLTPAEFQVKKTNYRASRPETQHLTHSTHEGGNHEPFMAPRTERVMAPRFGYFSPRGGYPVAPSWFALPQLSPRAAPIRVSSVRVGTPADPRPVIKVSPISEEPSQLEPSRGHESSWPPVEMREERRQLSTSSSSSSLTSSVAENRTLEPPVEHVPPTAHEVVADPEPEPELVPATRKESSADGERQHEAQEAQAEKAEPPPQESEPPKSSGGDFLSPRSKASPKAKAAAGKASPRALGRAAGGEGGLMTRERDKMTDLLDDRDKRNVFIACNFMRETIDTHPNENTEVLERDKAFLMFMVLFAAKLGAANKQHPIATACAHAASLAKGQIPTAKAKKLAPKVEFYLNRIAKPFLEYIFDPNPKMDAAKMARDIYDTARVSMGEKPAGLESRTGYLEDALRGWSLITAAELAKNEDAFLNLWRPLISAMDDCRKTGDAFTAAVDQAGKAIRP